MSVAIYINIDGVKGESQAKGFENQMQANTLYLGGTNTSSVGTGTAGSGAGRASAEVLRFSKVPDSASGSLFVGMASGKHFPTATISLVKAGSSKPYLTIKLTEVYISTWNLQNTSAHDELMVENVGVTYAKLQFEYSSQNAQGNVTSSGPKSWDIRAQG